MPKITGYPNFNTLPPEVAQQLKLVWDALISLSTDLSGISVPDLSQLSAALTTEIQRRTLADRNAAATAATVGALTTKGDLLTRNATAAARLGVGSDYQALRALAAASLGLAWDTPPCCVLTHNAGQVMPAGDNPLAFNTELEKTEAGLHDTVVNNDRITATRAGIWSFFGGARYDLNTSGTYRAVNIMKNGTTYLVTADQSPLNQVADLAVVTKRRLAVGDYVQFRANHDASTSRTIVSGSEFSPIFGAFWLSP